MQEPARSGKRSFIDLCRSSVVLLSVKDEFLQCLLCECDGSILSGHKIVIKSVEAAVNLPRFEFRKPPRERLFESQTEFAA